jgi:hypothetical protein
VDHLEGHGPDAERVRQAFRRDKSLAIPDKDRLAVGELVKYFNRQRSLQRARDLYMPAGKIRTPIYYFRAAASGRIRHDNWRRFSTKNIRIYEIVGDHYSIFRVPRVVDFAGIFSEIIKVDQLDKQTTARRN